MPVYKSNSPTKDGRRWFFKVQYEDPYGNLKTYVSKKYEKKTEAQDEERHFLTFTKDEKKNPSSMTIGQLWDDFLTYQSSRVKLTTMNNYNHTFPYFKNIVNIECKKFNIMHYERFRSELINCGKLKLVSKNDKLKVLRTLLNYGRRMYGFDFSLILAQPSKIKDPNALKPEMKIYSPEEFKLFIAEEDTILFKTLWKTLYYCGLRIGEARGLQWQDIDFANRTMQIKRQVVSPNNAKRNYYISSLKTTSSNRKLSLTSDLITDLLELQKTQTVFDNYTDEFFVFGSDYGIMPMGHSEPQKRKREIANRAGIKEIRLHDFRHSCASMLLSKGVPIPTVSKYMGHASVTETLNTYSHSLTSDFEGVSEVIERVF